MIFRGFLLGIAGSTGFGARGRTGIAALLVAVIYTLRVLLLQKRISLSGGGVLIGTLLGCMVVVFHGASAGDHHLPPQKADMLHGQIHDAIKPDTYIFVYTGSNNKSQTSLLTSKTLLRPGERIEVRVSSVVVASMPPPTRRKLSLPSLVSGEFDYEKRLAMKGYEAHLYSSSLRTNGEARLPWIVRQRQKVKQLLSQRISSHDVRGIVTGMLIGGRVEISQEVYDRFIRSGMVHILVVSGGNIMMVTVLLGAVFFFVPFYARVCLLVAGIVFYAVLCGADSSVLRALCMGCLTLLGMFAGRRIPLEKILQITVVGMLIRNPYFLMYDLGFLLSFSAVLGMVGLHRCLQPGRQFLPRRLFDGMTNYVAPCVGASLGVFPVLLISTGSMNMTGILINIILGPLIPFVLLLTGVTISLPASLLIGSEHALTRLVTLFFIGAEWADTYSRGVLLSSQTSKFLVSGSIILIYYIIYKYFSQEKVVV